MTNSAASDLDQPIDLLLSGGGFRATIFHLGVLRYLHERGYAHRVKQVYSVSGGSILAAFFSLNWSAIENPDAFGLAASEVVQYAQSDVRGKIVRRFIAHWLVLGALVLGATSSFIVPAISLYGRLGWACFFVLPAVVLFLKRPSLISLFQHDLSKFLHKVTEHSSSRKKATLSDMHEGAPSFRILTTDLTSGVPWVFSRDGVFMSDSGWDLFKHELYPLSHATSASAAFPPLFSPVVFSKDNDDNLFKVDHLLADGGVYDNLAIDAAVNGPWASPGTKTIISNAERRFDEYAPGSFAFLTQRAARSSDIQMCRASTLHGQLVDGEKIMLGDDIEGISDCLPIATQRRVRNIRTDLDAFSPTEIQLLYFKGYLTAWNSLDPSPAPTNDFQCTDEGVPIACKDKSRWLPFDFYKTELCDDVESALEDSHRARPGLLSSRDPRGVAGLLLALLLVALLNPITWIAAITAWDNLPGWPNVPKGNWYSGGANTKPDELPGPIIRLKDPLLNSVQYYAQKVASGMRSGNGIFVSNALSEAYGVWPRGSFAIEVDVLRPLQVVASEAFLIAPDGTLLQLLRSVKGNSLVIQVPAGYPKSHLAIALAGFDPESQINEDDSVAFLFNSETVSIRVTTSNQEKE